VLALAFYYIVVFHDMEHSDLRRFDSQAACEQSQRRAEEAMRAIWGVSKCFSIFPVGL
jgi:hypothetical protein